MIVLSLFDGMSCGQIALNRIGIKPVKYYAAEIDKWAIIVTQANYPNTIQLGDITKWKDWNIDWSSIDLVTGGFPCQAWSMAGKQLGDKDERGKLFWVMLDIIKHIRSINPAAQYLIENVKMKKEFEECITYHTEQALGHVEKTLINSALVSAQNRKRFYWTNFTVTQPDDKGLLLRDVLEFEGIGHIKSHREYVERNEKSMCLDEKDNLVIRPALLNGNKTGRVATALDIKGHDYNKRVYSRDSKSPTLTASSGGNQEPKVMVKQRPRGNNSGFEKLMSKAPTMSSSSWEHNVTVRQKSQCVRASGRGSYDRHEWDSISDCHYRKLTPVECERLQTVDDNYTLVFDESGKQLVSNTQRYKMLGNGWTIDVITHIFKHFAPQEKNSISHKDLSNE